MRALGIVQIILGIVALVYGGFTYTKREKVLDIGPVEAVKTTKKTIPLSPLVGGLAVAGGIALVMADRKSY